MAPVTIMRPVSRQASCRSASSVRFSSARAFSIVARPSAGFASTKYCNAAHSILPCGDLRAIASNRLTTG